MPFLQLFSFHSDLTKQKGTHFAMKGIPWQASAGKFTLRLILFLSIRNRSIQQYLLLPKKTVKNCSISTRSFGLALLDQTLKAVKTFRPS